jgi:diguanylate cyclase (GGDEF)-like protein/PAS domain S-box-containing protein
MNLFSTSAIRNDLDSGASVPVFTSGTERLLRNPLLTSMPMALVLTDQTGKCIGANEFALRLLALPHNVVVGRDIREFLPDSFTLSRHDMLAISSSATDVGEVRLRRDSATELRVALSVASLPASERPVIAYFFRDVTDEVAAIARLQAAVRTDPLTGLPNRIALEEDLDRTLRSISRGAPSAALCFLDLDDFKAVNDICGHAAGDATLQRIARVLRQRLRATDSIGRIGGDEFGLILHGCDLCDAENYIDDLRQMIAGLTIDLSRPSLQVGLSVGVTVLTEHTPSVAVALSEADRACYAAKFAGRSKTQHFTAQLDTSDQAPITGSRPRLSGQLSPA